MIISSKEATFLLRWWVGQQDASESKRVWLVFSANLITWVWPPEITLGKVYNLSSVLYTCTMAYTPPTINNKTITDFNDLSGKVIKQEGQQHTGAPRHQYYFVLATTVQYLQRYHQLVSSYAPSLRLRSLHPFFFNRANSDWFWTIGCRRNHTVSSESKPLATDSFCFCPFRILLPWTSEWRENT